jgi:23S rRNA pseudouridine2605 synthase
MNRARTTAGEDDAIRLNHFLARIGVASRRACDDIIAAGRVRVDGRPVRELGVKVVPGQSVVTVDGTPVAAPPRRIVLIMHKPKGFVTTVSDPEGRPTVIDLCRGVARKQRLFPVGRLDVNTTGALLITNDGLLCYRLTHPRFGIPRVYQVKIRGTVSESQLRRLERMAREASPGAPPARGQRRESKPAVDIVVRLPREREVVLRFRLLEGKNRQVRQMCEAVGLRIVALKRVSFGPVSIRKLPLGAVRPLERRELDRLDSILAMAAAGAGGARESA